jgi:hypothetical protein
LASKADVRADVLIGPVHDIAIVNAGEPVPPTSAAGMELIISSLCGLPSHGTHLLTRGDEVRVLVRNLFVSF